MSEEITDKVMQLLAETRLDIKADSVKLDVEMLIEDMNSQLDTLEKSENLSFKSIVLKLEQILEQSDPLLGSLNTLKNLSTSKDLREACSSGCIKINQYLTDVFMRPELYFLLKKYKGTDETLDPVDQRLLEYFLRQFRRNGLDLSTEKQSEFKEIQHEISRLASEGLKAINDAQDYILCTLEELDGVPESVIAKFEKEGELYKVTTAYPDYLPISEYAKKREIRVKANKIFSNRTLKLGNAERLEDLISLRARAAHLLGYESHADYKLEVKMAKTKDVVNDFLNNLEMKLRPYGEKEIAKILILLNEDYPNTTVPSTSDYFYYSRLVNEREHQLDNELIKQYFPTTETVDGMLSFYQSVFGLKFTKVQNAPTWHPDVTCYAFTDSDDVFRGVFFLDLFPRDGKFSHGGTDLILWGKKDELGYHPGCCVMMCNFEKPTGNNPSLLKHFDISTLYHEFGHIVALLSSSVKYVSLSKNIAWDFIEAPSQIFENWIWESKVLKHITKHYQTGEPMPDEMIEKLVESRYNMIALFNLIQIAYSKFDMAIYTSDEADIKETWHSIFQSTILFNTIPDTNPAASVMHFFADYDAGFYGYLWSKVMAQDMYTKFQEMGIDSPKIGINYRKTVLEQLGQEDEIKLVETFLGRKINNEAFLKSLGL